MEKADPNIEKVEDIAGSTVITLKEARDIGDTREARRQWDEYLEQKKGPRGIESWEDYTAQMHSPSKTARHTGLDITEEAAVVQPSTKPQKPDKNSYLGRTDEWAFSKTYGTDETIVRMRIDHISEGERVALMDQMQQVLIARGITDREGAESCIERENSVAFGIIAGKAVETIRINNPLVIEALQREGMLPPTDNEYSKQINESSKIAIKEYMGTNKIDVVSKKDGERLVATIPKAQQSGWVRG